MCFNPEFNCPAPRNVCGLPMTEHIRRYIHNHAQVTVTVEAHPTPSPGFQDTLLMWSECQVCHQHTPVVPMSEETWKFSFGKFLEILFYHKQLHCRADLCPHAINHHHVLNFGYRELAARFYYAPVPLYEVSIPSMKLYINSQSNVHLKQKDVERLRECIARFWDSVADRLRGFDIWDLVAVDRVDYCRADLQELLKIAEAEQVYMLQFVNQVNENTHPADTLALNAVRTVIQEKVYDWNTRFEQFAREYILPERDLRKNAGRKLRHLFLGPSNNTATAGGPGTTANGPGSTPLVTPADGVVPKPMPYQPGGTVSVQGSPPSHPPPMLGADSQTLHRHLEQLSLQPLANTRPTGDGSSKEQSSSTAIDPACLPSLSDVSDGEPPGENSEIVLPTSQQVDEFLTSLESQEQKDLHWLPYAVNMDRKLYRKLSLEHMRQEIEEKRVTLYQDWAVGTQGGDKEWVPEYEGEDDSDHLGYPSLRSMAGTPDV
ncbi:Mitochondrial distribution and morphology protein 12, partial [Dispira parvispora]